MNKRVGGGGSGETAPLHLTWISTPHPLHDFLDLFSIPPSAFTFLNGRVPAFLVSHGLAATSGPSSSSLSFSIPFLTLLYPNASTAILFHNENSCRTLNHSPPSTQAVAELEPHGEPRTSILIARQNLSALDSLHWKTPSAHPSQFCL